MGFMEVIKFNPKTRKNMIKRTYPDKKVEWLPLSEWGLVKELETCALIFEEGEKEGKGTFWKASIKLSVDPKIKELYLKMSERRQIVDGNTGHVRIYAAPVIKDVSTGTSTFAVISPFLKTQDFDLSRAPHVVYTNLSVSDAEKITKEEAAKILETPLGCCGVFRDFALRERLY